MYVILSATAPLCVLEAASEAAEPLELATLAAPTVLGEIGMWRNGPAACHPNSSATSSQSWPRSADAWSRREWLIGRYAPERECGDGRCRAISWWCSAACSA
jgi:hypothetical protein